MAKKVLQNICGNKGFVSDACMTLKVMYKMALEKPNFHRQFAFSLPTMNVNGPFVCTLVHYDCNLKGSSSSSKLEQTFQVVC